MNDTPATPSASLPIPAPQPDPVAPTSADDDTPTHWVRWAVLILSIAAAGAGYLAWQTHNRVQRIEQELVRRQQDTQNQTTEARILAKQAQELSREAAARATLVETRLSEVTLQRSQVEDLIKTLSQSRDESMLSDIDAGLRLASQQASLTGSVEPLVTALQNADARIARAKQPRLDNVRRAIARDLDRIKATRVADLSMLTIRLDEAIRLVDEVPLLNQPDHPAAAPQPPKGSKTGKPSASHPAAGDPASSAASAAAAEGTASAPWHAALLDWGRDTAQSVWQETRSLIRLTKINQPEGMLLAPDQAYFLKENVKLRLLNARLALLSRQVNLARTDLQGIAQTLPRYFDMQSRKTQLLHNLINDVAQQSQQTVLPRPDDTLAALTALTGNR